jgi:MFS family permease
MRRPADVILLYAARAARGFGDGFAIIILPAYLSELGFGPFQIGIVASAALLGTAAVTLAIGFLAPGRDLRNLLLVGAFATVATGIAFPATEQLGFILLVAFVGTMNPSSGDIGLFVPLEHAMLAREAADHDRTRIFAHYSLIGGLSSAAGALAAAAPTALASAGR